MDVRLLGPLEARVDGRPLPLGGRKQRALLAVLALGAGRTVSTERLVDELWGEDPPETAVKMVQIYVSQLRKVLPEGLLVTRPPGYVLAVEPEDVDLQAVERLLADGRAALAGGQAERAAALLADALERWRGPALAEFAGEPFGRVEIPRLEELQLAVLEERVEADLALGRHAEVAGELESLVARHPLRERLRGQQLVALYRSGRQADALASYQGFRRMLDEELGIEPSARLRELERSILRQDPSLDAPAPPRRRTAARPGRATPRPVGRDGELDQLREALDVARGGERRLVLVIGEPGVGKTALLEAFLAEAEAAGELLVARGLCVEQRGPAEPYLPILDALGRLCGGERGAEVVPVLQHRGPTWLAQMPWHLPAAELDALHVSVLGATRDRMLRELGEALDAVAGLAPLALVLEDLQWSDLATVDALAWVARREGAAPLLLLGTVARLEGSEPADAVLALADELRVRRRSVEIPLEGLDADALGELVAARIGPGELAERLAGLLLERTGGNPLFAGTVLEGWVADGKVAPAEDGWALVGSVEELGTAVPRSIRAVVLRRFEQLEPAEQQVLAAASVAGTEAAAAAVAAATGTAEHEVELLAEELVRRGSFLEPLEPAEWPDGTVSARYAFTHQVHRQVLYESVPTARRARLHRRIAQRLEAGYGERSVEIAAELAAHYERGLEPASAVRCLRLAAELSLRRLAPRPATALLRAALAALEGLPSGVERDRLELDLLVLLGQALVVSDGWTSEEAEVALDRARLLGTRLADNEPIVPVLVALGTIYEVRGDYERAERVGRECLRVVPEAAGESRLQAHEVLACSLFHQGSFSRALEHAELGAALEEQGVVETPDVVVLGDDVGVSCHDWAALALWFLGRPDAALARAERALLLAAEPRRAYGLAAAHVQAAIVHQCRGDVESTRAAAARTVELAGDRGYAYRVALGAALHGWARAAGGDPDGVSELREALGAARATGVRMDEPYLLGLLADALVRLGRHGDAGEVLAEALARPSFYEAELMRLRAGVERARGPHDGEATLEAALGTARRQGARSLELRVAVDLAELLAERGDARRAAAVLAEARGRLVGGGGTADARAADALLARLASGVAPPQRPVTAHVLSGGVRLAYQVTGVGPPDVVLVPGFVTHLELDWEEPGHARFLERLGGLGRLIRTDKRGTGLSDRGVRVPDLETRVDDLRAVMDALGSERAVVVGLSEGVSTALLLAATHPERVSALVLFGGYAKRLDPDDDYPWAPTAEERTAYVERVVGAGGYEWDLELMAPSAAPGLRAWWAARCRAGASTEAARELMEMNSQIDVRDVLPAIHVPTLVVHRGSGYVGAEEGRYVAGRIPGARFVELPGEDHVVAVDPDAILDVVEPFVTEVAAEAGDGDLARVLATILVTDIVGSTETVARVGDAAWARLLERHHQVVREELARFAGVEVETAGDGFLASFDGPGRALRCALALQERLVPLGVAARAGVHTGEVERSGDRLTGVAVHIAARVAAEAAPGEVLVTATTRDLVAGGGLAFADRGERTLPGFGEPRRLYAALPRKEGDLPSGSASAHDP
jgi:DNA-binding SARP family transcriptional activator/class 3 adenylate cyclase/tetratricopeptide (TPR) repeat protein